MEGMLRDWHSFFSSVSEKEYAKKLHAFLDEEYASKVIYPPRHLLFNAFSLTNPSTLKAVIIGQDPYHNPGQAMGLSFSVPQGIAPPPSLKNIYKEIENDLGISMDFSNGDLTIWAQQGVLLLNAYLSVRAGVPLSHRIPEYDSFMSDLMAYLDGLDQPIVFFLWGGFAKKYESVVHNANRLILKASHPSPLALAHGGWFGNHHFSRANEYLESRGSKPIDWGNRLS